MFNSLLTPLRSGFNLTSPRSTTNISNVTANANEPDSPEDIVRDAMMELMRVNVEKLRAQMIMAEKIEVTIPCSGFSPH
jgi:hypothetical protein